MTDYDPAPAPVAARPSRRMRFAYKVRRRAHRGGWQGWRRIADVIEGWRHWYSWGHPVMALTGTDFGGNWNPPDPGSWYFTWAEPSDPAAREHAWTPWWRRRILRSRHTGRVLVVVRDWQTMQDLNRRWAEQREAWSAAYQALPASARPAVGKDPGVLGPRPTEPDWHTFSVQDDGGTFRPGNGYDSSTHYGLGLPEVALLRAYLRRWRRHNWFGLRRWLHYKALHSAVNDRIPFSCQQTPPPGGGGYTHWHCQLGRRHPGKHRYRNYTWDNEGEQLVLPGVHGPGPAR